MTEINTNFDTDPFDDEEELGRNTAVPVRVIKDEGEDSEVVNKIVSHDDYAPVIQNGLSIQTVYVQAKQGWVFDIGMLVIATFTAGTVSVYKNFVADESLICTFPVAGNFQFSKGQLVLRTGDQLIIVANGVTGNVTPSMHGNMVRRAWFPEYIM